MKEKALLLGGTGAMGVYLIPELLKLNYEVFVTTRRDKKSNDPNLHFIIGNAHEKSFLKELLQQNWNVIIDFMVYSTKDFASKFTFFLESTDQYFFISSYRVFADSKTPVVESSPKLLDVIEDPIYLETDEYGLAKARQENILINSSYSNWTIIRPSVTYSKRRFQLATLEADSILYRANLGLPVPISEEILKKRTTMTWAGDVAKMIAGLVNKEEAFQEDYNVVTSESVLWSDVAQIYAKYANMKIHKINHSNYLKIVGDSYQIKYDRMFDRIMDNSKILKATGLKQDDLTPLEEGLSSEINKYFLNRDFIQSVNYVTQAKMDRITHSRVPMKRVQLKDKFKYLLSYLELKRR